jgi:hypothetical protein
MPTSMLVKSSTSTRCAHWAPFYDETGNELLEIEQPVVCEILDGLPAANSCLFAVFCCHFDNVWT